MDDREKNLQALRERMVNEQIVARGIHDARVVDALRQVPRHRFVDPDQEGEAYEDNPLPIGESQTISQPYMVGLMSELLQLKGSERVLEIGTGSGYQTAILARLASIIYTVERLPGLVQRAERIWRILGIDNIRLRISDGTLGWPEEAPFQAILVTAGAPEIPKPLGEQLTIGGRLVIPVGDRWGQLLLRLVKQRDGSLRKEISIPCRFVQLVGEYGWHEPNPWSE
jgi:protein-L-isoaspartate(D-aspartate) O-methyltransferase